MKKAYITCGLIFEDKDAALIIAQDKMIHEIDVNDYTDVLRTEIEIEVDSLGEINLSVFPVESKFSFDEFLEIATAGSFEKTYNHGDDSVGECAGYEITDICFPLIRSTEFSFKFHEKITDKISETINA